MSVHEFLKANGLRSVVMEELSHYQEKPQYLNYGRDIIDLNKLFIVTKDLKVTKGLHIETVNYNPVEVHIGSTDKKKIREHEIRSMNTDLGTPVLVSMGDNGKWNLLDGWHRISKANRLGKSVDYKVVPPNVLKLAFVTREEVASRGHKLDW
jgi:hypothetical protein